MKRLLFLIILILTILSTSSISAHNNIVMKSNLSYVRQTLDSINSTGINKLTFCFRLNQSELDVNYRSNSQSFNQLDKILNDSTLLSSIERFKVVATSSPDGNYTDNLTLAQLRVLSFEQMLLKRYPSLSDSIIDVDSYVTDWSKLHELIKYDVDVPWFGTVIEILNRDTTFASKQYQLRELKDSWKYISNKYLKYLRDGEVIIAITVKKQDVKLIPIIKIEEKAKPILIPTPKEETVLKPLFALKTNLLFDALSLINIELEVPIGDRWSIAGDVVFPWWTMDNDKADSKRNRIQLFNFNLEGRYWFGDREDRPVMTGWFGGFYVGGGLYDFERSGKGYQGEFSIMGGLSGGYAHTINKKGNLRMEYSLGVGYMQTDYRYYESHFAPTNVWHPLYESGGRYTWFGPTKAKISLVWMLNKIGERK